MKGRKSIEPTGNPLDLEDKEHCSVVLTTDTMNVKVEGKYRQRERKLYVLLVHAVWDEIGTKPEYQVEAEQIKRVFKEVAGVKGFNNWLWEYLENLARIEITFEDERYRGVTRLLSKVIADKETGSVRFEIPKEIEKGIKCPTQYGRLDTYFLVGLKGKYSVSLYQLLESKINLQKFNPIENPNKKDRFIQMNIEELRDWLGVGSMYPAWKDFKKRALKPAVEEINSNPIASTFTVEIEEVKGSRKKVVAVKFFLTKTPERLNLEKSLQVTKEAKRIAEKSSLIPAFRGTKVYEDARKIIPRGYDLHSLEEEWRDYSYQKNESVKYPERAFLRWLENKFENKERENQSKGFFNSLLSKIASNE